MDNRALKVAEVANCMALNPKTVYRMLERGELRGVKAGRVWRVPADALAEYLKGRTHYNELPVGIQGKDLVRKKREVGSWRRWRGALKGADALREHEEEHREETRRDAKGA